MPETWARGHWGESDREPEMIDYLKIAIESSLIAGREILNIYQHDFSVIEKDDRSPLTDADSASHRIISADLKQTGLPILSEEGQVTVYSERRQWDRFWMIDPLDGTKEFVKKNGEFTVNIALIQNTRPVLGVVLAPVLNKIYWGVQSDGINEAWVANDCMGSSVSEVLKHAQPIGAQVSKSMRAVASRSHCNAETESFLSELEGAFGAVDRISSGSSMKLCMVADGTAAIYPRIAPTMEWDTAAAQAVVEAAGGHVFLYDPAIKASQYLDSECVSSKDKLKTLEYNKQNLLNPCFVVAGECRD